MSIIPIMFIKKGGLRFIVKICEKRSALVNYFRDDCRVGEFSDLRRIRFFILRDEVLYCRVA